jgi:ABC-type uncharacterized transport system permease subunit
MSLQTGLYLLPYVLSVLLCAGVGLYGFGLVVAALVLLLAFLLHSPRLYHIQTSIIILGTLFPLLGTVLTLAGVSPGFHRKRAPFLDGADVAKECLARGADGYLTKPVDTRHLQHQARDLVQGHTARI